MRNLERRIGEICRKAAREFLEKKKKTVHITEGNLQKYLGKEKITFENANEEDEVGIGKRSCVDKRRRRHTSDRSECNAG